MRFSEFLNLFRWVHSKVLDSQVSYAHKSLYCITEARRPFISNHDPRFKIVCIFEIVIGYRFYLLGSD